MHRFLSAALPALLFLAAAAGAAEQGPYPETEEALDAEYAKLQWVEEPGRYDLERSHGALSVPAGQSLILGHDAERLLFLMNGTEFPLTEAVLYEDATNVFVVFEYFDDGFVKDEDWSDVDADALLKSIREGSELQNEERAKYGISPMTVRGWREPPKYDPANNTVRWAIEFDEDGSVTVNAVALKLGRNGYEQLTWVGSGGQYDQMGGMLVTALDGHAFDEGHRYADFQDGDKVAAYGLGALVATVAGAKLGKGILAALLLFLKKGWVLVVAAIGGIGALIRKRRGKAQSASGE